LSENGEALARMKEDLLSSKKTLVEARDAFVSSSEVISQKDKYVEFLKKSFKRVKPRIIKLSNRVVLSLLNQEG
jgi:hypothetical protein